MCWDMYLFMENMVTFDSLSITRDSLSSQNISRLFSGFCSSLDLMYAQIPDTTCGRGSTRFPSSDAMSSDNRYGGWPPVFLSFLPFVLPLFFAVAFCFCFSLLFFLAAASSWFMDGNGSTCTEMYRFMVNMSNLSVLKHFFIALSRTISFLLFGFCSSCFRMYAHRPFTMAVLASFTSSLLSDGIGTTPALRRNLASLVDIFFFADSPPPSPLDLLVFAGVPSVSMSLSSSSSSSLSCSPSLSAAMLLMATVSSSRMNCDFSFNSAYDTSISLLPLLRACS
mmetsp:Transcript_16343/g.45291  ORF Transcript_16343/g.45291 Transcript_16343/m.45291 type:complete len:281 (-) Transcript_16343:192-1034(-)